MLANCCHLPATNLWHLFTDDPDPGPLASVVPPQITGNEPILEPRADEVAKG